MTAPICAAKGSTVMRRHGKWPAAGAVAVVLLSLQGCLGGGDAQWKDPDKGQAEVLLRTADENGGSSGAAWLAFDGDPDGLTVGPDGKVYGMSASLAVIEDDHRARTVLDGEVHGVGGLVVLSPNSFVVGARSQLLNVRTDGKRRTVLAGAPGGPRKLGQPAPATASAQDVHLSDQPVEPFGKRPDGTLLFTDGDVIWQLKEGRLTRLYQVPADRGDAAGRAIARGSAVDRSGTVYLRTSAEGAQGRLADVVTVHQDGSVAKLAVPEQADGVKGNLSDLRPTWMAGDDGNGVYVRAHDDTAQYVLHLTAQKAEVVAKQASGGSRGDSDAGCDEGHLVDATKLPCPMPEALTYSSGALVMAGNAPFVLKIATR
ncbi:hypothetical protein N4G70_09800 [Streptomyces sp. ASQP_92]|uniref:hypothetical protein n=1 Tax=Streptomyces sp. ASQP_92 TaxID=2979116 RepID=UPI0021BFAA5C|nr:hypothetical protein [Streptomyces sp. ASQP_92]MCT9089162.1 hypothetical protein [Streptomyces sp. ASQP_92]